MYIFCTENDSVFPVLSDKNCDVASEAPSFDMDDIINRLKKININKSPGPYQGRIQESALRGVSPSLFPSPPLPPSLLSSSPHFLSPPFPSPSLLSPFPFSSLPSHPLPSLPLPLEVGPVLRLGGLGERSSGEEREGECRGGEGKGRREKRESRGRLLFQTFLGPGWG